MRDRNERLLTLVLVVAVLASSLGVIYLSATAQESTDPYTELYVLGPGGNASDYPDNLSVGESGTVIVGISNHERREIQYTVELRLDDRVVTTQTLSIENEETVEREHSFTAEAPGDKRLRILLYRGDKGENSEPYRSVYIWVSIEKR